MSFDDLFGMGKKVLLVEDDNLAGKFLKLVLEKKGFYVYLALDGERALELYKLKRINLIVCDVHLPRMDGLEFIKRVKKTPIMMITGNPTRDVFDKSVKSGAVDFITKSEFDEVEFLERIYRLVVDTKPQGKEKPNDRA